MFVVGRQGAAAAAAFAGAFLTLSALAGRAKTFSRTASSPTFEPHLQMGVWKESGVSEGMHTQLAALLHMTKCVTKCRLTRRV